MAASSVDAIAIECSDELDIDDEVLIRQLVKIQACVRGWISRRALAQIKSLYEEIVRDIEGDDIQVLWKNNDPLVRPVVYGRKYLGNLELAEQKNKEICNVTRTVKKAFPDSHHFSVCHNDSHGNLRETKGSEQIQSFSKEAQTEQLDDMACDGSQFMRHAVRDRSIDRQESVIKAMGTKLASAVSCVAIQTDRQDDLNSRSQDVIKEEGSQVLPNGLDGARTEMITNCSDFPLAQSQDNHCSPPPENRCSPQPRDVECNEVFREGNAALNTIMSHETGIVSSSKETLAEDNPSSNQVRDSDVSCLFPTTEKLSNLPDDKCELMQLKNITAMEFLWVQQAINSRKHYLRLRQQLV